MSIVPAADIVHIWTDSRTPSRLVWRDHRYRVIAAEPVRSTMVHDAFTHPAEQLVGWSVVAISDQDPSEVRSMQLQSVGTGWVLINVGPA
ncbi:hypothetical protein ABH923_003220 [Leifsonia sp. EB41]|uniref:hypothetical protein n=1 Tax=Leifsonia sp. EB41 TaxID=3156260 RepID=UPI0035194787